MVVLGSAWEAASCTSRSGTSASSAAVMNPCVSVCGPMGLAIPARRAIRWTIRAAPCRSSRRPSGASKTGPSLRSPMARSIARAVRGASGMVTTLPPLHFLHAQGLNVCTSSLGDPQLVAVQPRPADVRGGRMIEEFFLDGVAVEPRDGAQPAGDGGPGTATGFQVAGEALNIGAACLEQSKMMLLAPARVLALVQIVRGAG